MATTEIERKYVLTRIEAGDYLLPSNDRKTLWRIRKLWDGPSYGLDVEWSDREFWGLWRLIGRDGERFPDEFPSGDIEEWDWDFYEGLIDTRREAINRALAVNP